MRVSHIFAASMLFCVSVSVADDVAGTLSAGATANFEGFLFDVFEINVAGATRLSVSMSSAKLDSYLLVVDPQGDVQINDDGVLSGAQRQNSRDAALEFHSPAQGRWLIVTTTQRRNESGSYNLAVLGASGPPNKQPRPIREEVARAFLSRGIRDSELAIVSAYEQLTLKSFRSELISRLRLESSQQNGRAQVAPDGLPQLEERLARVTSAQAEVSQRLTVSNKFVGDLLAKERESIEGQIARATKERDVAVARLGALAIALQKLEAFDRLDSELKDLESLLIEHPTSANDEQRKRVLQLRSRRAADGRALAELLMRSRMISPSSTAALNGYTLYSEVRGETRFDRFGFGFGLGLGLGLEASLGSALKDLLDGQAMGAIVAGAIGGGARFHREETVLDTTLWLPALLPWPPPAPSSQVILDRTALLGDDTVSSLGELDDLIQASLARAGYSGSTYWGVPGGFALVTPLEQTDQHGVPLQADRRWSSRIIAMKEFSLAEYLRALLMAPVGFFRILLFVVSPVTFASKDNREIMATVERWTRGGLNALPELIARQPFTSNHRVNVLVYEFVKQEDAQQPKAEVPGRLKAPDHLRAVKFSYYSRQ